MNQMRNKRLYCTAMTDSLGPNVTKNSDKFDYNVPLKKKKITHTKFEEIKSINTQHSKVPNMNIQALKLKENSDLNFSFENSMNTLSFTTLSTSIQSLADDMKKIKIQKTNNVNEQKIVPNKKTQFDSSLVNNPDKNKSKTLTRNFSLSELNTQTRSNFKNLFNEIIKNNNVEKNRRSFTNNKINSFSSTNFNSNFVNKFKEKKIFTEKVITTPIIEKINKEYQTPKFNDIEETPNFRQIDLNNKNNFFQLEEKNKENLVAKEYLIPNKKIQVNIFKTKLKYNN